MIELMILIFDHPQVPDAARDPLLRMPIGRDIYLGSRLIIETLERKIPEGSLGVETADQKAVQKLLQRWIIDGGILSKLGQLIPVDSPMLKDQNFIKDREELTGRSWKKEEIQRMRPEAMAETRDLFDFMETTLLADGRHWILKTPKPSLADIEAIWPFQWIVEIKGALPPSLVSAKIYPKVYAWIGRFNAAISSAKSSAPKPRSLKGAEALKQIVSAGDNGPTLEIDGNDPFHLRMGQNIEVWPIDSGFNHHEQGRLLGLSKDEVVLEAQTKIGDKTVRVHAPRHGFRIRPATGGSGANL
ncbi:MAG: hypothetical protein M1837_006515 [Sclerophora amabilis]|nr:MAG: hypothetical protein M1837_006515 [Sclerophora amabilis]